MPLQKQREPRAQWHRWPMVLLLLLLLLLVLLLLLLLLLVAVVPVLVTLSRSKRVGSQNPTFSRR